MVSLTVETMLNIFSLNDLKIGEVYLLNISIIIKSTINTIINVTTVFIENSWAFFDLNIIKEKLNSAIY